MTTVNFKGQEVNFSELKESNLFFFHYYPNRGIDVRIDEQCSYEDSMFNGAWFKFYSYRFKTGRKLLKQVFLNPEQIKGKKINTPTGATMLIISPKKSNEKPFYI